MLPTTKRGKFKTGGFRWMKGLGAWRYAGMYYYPGDDEFERLDRIGRSIGRKK